VISNWSARLQRVLAAVGLGDAFDPVLCSACESLEKPDPELFRLALGARRRSAGRGRAARRRRSLERRARGARGGPRRRLGRSRRPPGRTLPRRARSGAWAGFRSSATLSSPPSMTALEPKAPPPGETRRDRRALRARARGLRRGCAKRVSARFLGHRDVVDLLLACVCSPTATRCSRARRGLGKTTLVKSLGGRARPRVPARAVHARPDAGDILGMRMLEEDAAAGAASASRRPGLRAESCSPTRSTARRRARSRRCSRRCRSGRSRSSARPAARRALHRVATQNPIEMEGTYPLPEAELDRFLCKLELGAPGRGRARDDPRGHGRALSLPAIPPLDPAALRDMRAPRAHGSPVLGHDAARGARRAPDRPVDPAAPEDVKRYLRFGASRARRSGAAPAWKGARPLLRPPLGRRRGPARGRRPRAAPPSGLRNTRARRAGSTRTSSCARRSARRPARREPTGRFG
jgi:hypothetical protein